MPETLNCEFWEDAADGIFFRNQLATRGHQTFDTPYLQQNHKSATTIFAYFFAISTDKNSSSFSSSKQDEHPETLKLLKALTLQLIMRSRLLTTFPSP